MTSVQQHQLLLTGLHCVSCVRHIEELLAEHKLEDINVSLFAGTASFSHAAGLDLKPILRELEDAGFKAVQPEKHATPGELISHPHSSKLRPAPLRWLDYALPGKRHQRRRHKQVCEACRAEEAGELLLDDPKSSSPPLVAPQKPRWSRSTFSINGMTCSSCVGALKTGLQEDAIRSVDITLMPGRAVIEHDTSKLNVEAIKEMIEDLGYEGTLDESHTLDANPTARWQAKLSVTGMTCASCTGSVKNALQQIPGASAIVVELTSGMATVQLAEERDAGLASEEVKDAGFDCEIVEVRSVDDNAVKKDAAQKIRTLRMRVDGMFCHDCVGKVNARFEQLMQQYEGLTFSPVTLRSPVTLVSYPPDGAMRLRRIRQQVWELGFGFTPAPVDSIEQRAAKARAKEQRRILIRVTIAFAFAIPTFVIAVVGMSLLSSGNSFRQYLEESVWGNASRGEIVLWALATPVQFGVGAFFYVRSWKSLRAVWRRRRASTTWKSVLVQRLFRWGSMDTLVALGTSLAYFSSVAFLALDITSSTADGGGMGYFDTSVFLILFILAGRYLEAVSKQHTGDAISELNKSKANKGLLYTPGDTQKGSTTEEVEAAFLDIGDLLLVPAGESPALDGVMIEKSSSTSFDESALTGEARPVLKQAGDVVYAGTINRGPAAAVIRLSTSSGHSMVDGIASAVRDAMSKKASIERIADTITAFFVPAIVAIACFTFVVWLMRGYLGNLPESWLGADTRGGWALFALEFAVAVLVVACPCGIGLAAPTAQLVGVGLAAKHGILPNGGGEAFQAFSRITTLVLDKTGTLTASDFQVSDVEMFIEDPADRSLLWALASVVEAASSHPLSVGLRKRCEAELNGANGHMELIKSEEVAGRGLVATVAIGEAGETFEICIGNEALMHERSASYDSDAQTSAAADAVRRWQDQAKSVILLAVRPPSDHRMLPTLQGDYPHILAVFGMHDPPRPEARSVIQQMKTYGITTWICTGDNEATAKAVAMSVGIEPDHVVAHALPEDKRDLVKRLQATSEAKRSYVAFCGDGINDSPALAQADAGIAMGGGSAVALKAAHFTLVGSSLLGLVTLRALSRSTMHKIYSNFAWASFYNVVLIPLAAGAFYQLGQTKLPAVWASLAMALSSVSVVTNSLLLRVMFRTPRMVKAWRASHM